MWKTVRFVAALIFAVPAMPYLLVAARRVDWPLVGSHLFAATVGGPIILFLAWRLWCAWARRAF